MPKLWELANLVKGEVLGDGNVEIIGASAIEDAGPGEITFAASARYLNKAFYSNATAVIVPSIIAVAEKPALVVANPRLAFAQILNYFTPKIFCQPGIHPSAVIGRGFQDDGAEIGPLACIGDDVKIGKGTIIHPGVVIGNRVKIGENCVIYGKTVIREDCVIGNKVQIHAGAVIGADGFDYVTASDGHHLKVPKVGRVIIEDEVEIGANVTIDRATTDVTLISRGTKIDNLVHIAHDCKVGEDVMICGMTGIARHVKIGDRVILAGRAAVIENLKVGADSIIAACTMVINSLPSNSFVSGAPARPHAEDMRIQAAVGRLPQLLKEIKDLQKKLAELEESI